MDTEVVLSDHRPFAAAGPPLEGFCEKCGFRWPCPTELRERRLAKLEGVVRTFYDLDSYLAEQAGALEVMPELRDE